MARNNNPATADDHDYEVTRYNARTGAPYSVWVRVTHFAQEEQQTWDDPGTPAEIEAFGWGSFEQEIDLDDDELMSLVDSILNPEPEIDEWELYAA